MRQPDHRPIRVLVAVSHRPACVGAARALRAAGLDVVAECQDAAAAVAAAELRQPDVCVVDDRVPGGGRAAVAALAAVEPAPRVIVLGPEAGVDGVLAALEAGASGYLLEDVTAGGLTAAVVDVALGNMAIAPALVTHLVDAVRAVRDQAAPTRLTNRERQVLGLLSVGMVTKQVALHLGLSPTTVRRHASTAVRKLGAADRRAAIAGLTRVQGCERR